MDHTLAFLLCFTAVLLFLLVPIYYTCKHIERIQYENLNKLENLNEN